MKPCGDCGSTVTIDRHGEVFACNGCNAWLCSNCLFQGMLRDPGTTLSTFQQPNPRAFVPGAPSEVRGWRLSKANGYSIRCRACTTKEPPLSGGPLGEPVQC